jgi:hypothetical protein
MALAFASFSTTHHGDDVLIPIMAVTDVVKLKVIRFPFSPGEK